MTGKEKQDIESLSEILIKAANDENKKMILIKARPNANRTQITSYNGETEEFSIDVAAPPDKNKANSELMKYISRLIKKKVEISGGATSRHKHLKIME